MAVNPNAQLREQVETVVGLAPITPSTSTPDYINFKAGERALVTIVGLNATTVTGSAITLKQAKDAAATDEKALAFTKMWADTDVGAGFGMTETAVTSNTFTTTAVNSKSYLYQIEVRAEDLDNGFTHIRAGTGNAIATTLAVIYQIYPLRYAAGKVDPTA